MYILAGWTWFKDMNLIVVDIEEQPKMPCNWATKREVIFSELIPFGFR